MNATFGNIPVKSFRDFIRMTIKAAELPCELAENSPVYVLPTEDTARELILGAGEQVHLMPFDLGMVVEYSGHPPSLCLEAKGVNSMIDEVALDSTLQLGEIHDLLRTGINRIEARQHP